MIYGITGHQEREGIDWAWVRVMIRGEVQCGGPDLRGLSSLARGADQVFAEEILQAQGALTAIIPLEGYEENFRGEDLSRYQRLLSSSEVIMMPEAKDDEAAFLAAGMRVADDCDVLLAVWDGEPAAGSGGTGDVVGHAKTIGRAIVHFQPITREVARY
ncbi:hypothetical protein KX816_18350 [Sphingosinicellaceae bacterium]|nr:hypothetical protein KX816_18350 [Sphingosinicellaceae bacterium]